MSSLSKRNTFRHEAELFAESIVTDADSELSAHNGCKALAAVCASLESARNDGASVLIADILEMARANVWGEARNSRVSVATR